MSPSTVRRVKPRSYNGLDMRVRWERPKMHIAFWRGNLLEGSQPLGRPRKWQDSIKMSLGETGCEAGTWMKLRIQSNVDLVLAVLNSWVLLSLNQLQKEHDKKSYFCLYITPDANTFLQNKSKHQDNTLV
jgi:hypothetical protein